MSVRRTMMAAVLAAAAALARAPAAPAAEDGEPPIAFSDWKIERFRYDENKIPKAVKAEIKMTNTGKEDLTEFKTRIVYYTAAGEMVRETTWQFAMNLAAGKSLVFKYHEGMVPAFEAYELIVGCKMAGKEQKWVWRSSDPGDPPGYRPDKPVAGCSRLVILGREATRDSKTGQARFFCRIKNEGELPAERTAVTVDFLDDKGKVVASHELPVGEGGTVPGGKEVTVNATIPKAVPIYQTCRARLTASKAAGEESLSGGKFTNAAEVEVAEVVFKRPKPPELSVEGKIRNGHKKAVENPAVTWIFTDGGKEVRRFVYRMEGRLDPAEIRPIKLTVPDCPSFGAYSYEVDFAEARAESFPPVIAQVAEGKAGVERIEVTKGEGGALKFTAALRSRAPHEVSAFKVTFLLLGKNKSKVGECTATLEKLAAGATATLTAEMGNPPPFANYTYNATYTEPTPPKQQ